MAVKIRLKRMGKTRQPFYRIVVADSRKKRDGRVIEEIGKYHPKEEPSFIEVKSERAAYWLGVGAQPTEAVEAILKLTGDWQRHHGQDVPEGALKTAQPKPNKQALYEAALSASQNESEGAAVTPKKDKPAKAEEPKAAKAEEPKAEEPKAEEPKADEAKADEAKAEEPKADESASEA